MNSFWLNAIFTAVRYFANKDLFDQVLSLVDLYTTVDLPGDEKRKAVHARLKEMGGALGDRVRSFAPIVLNMIIETAVVEVNKRLGKTLVKA